MSHARVIAVLAYYTVVRYNTVCSRLCT